MIYSVIIKIVRIIASLIFRVKIENIENIPKEEACILALNHTSLLDPPVVGSFIPRKLTFMAKDELFHIPILGVLIRELGAFPVKRGTGDVRAIKTALNILKENNALMIYPEGTRVKSKKIVHAKPGIALIAIKAQVPVIPIAVTGKYKLFHRISIRIGSPISLEQYYQKKLDTEKLQQISDDILHSIYGLMEDF